MDQQGTDRHGGIAGIASVTIWTSADRYEDLVRFYTEQVGLTRDPDDRHAAFTWGTPPDRFRLILGRHSDVSGASTEPDRVMLNLLVFNIEEVAAGMAERGVVFIQPPTPQRWGGSIATFRDPDNNTIQLMQPAPVE